eukprot:4296619-Pyramimonas_sp.AAC.1
MGSGRTDPGQCKPGSVRPGRILRNRAGPCRILHASLGQCTPGPAGSCKIRPGCPPFALTRVP